MAEPLEEAAQKLEASAKALTDLPVLVRAALAQQQAQQAAPLSYVYQPGPTTAQQQAQQQQQQHYPPGGAPAWQQPAPTPTPLQAAQQAASAGPTPGDLALAAARAGGPAGAQAQQATGGMTNALLGTTRNLSALATAALGASATLGLIQQLGAKASPQAAATLSGSIDLLMARIGSHLLPAFEEASRAIQAFARAVPDASQTLIEFRGYKLNTFDLVTGSSFKGLKTIMDVLGIDKPAQSWAGLPQARTSTHEEAYERMQQAALNQDPLQTQLMQEQLANLKDILGVLKERPTTNPGAALNVNFR